MNDSTVDTNSGLDPSFADKGVADDFQRSLPFKIVEGRADGKILLVGSKADPKFQLVQLLKNGTPDLEFGVEGTVTGVFAAGFGAIGISAHLLADEKILLIGGHWVQPTRLVTALARFHRNGTPDISFGVNGIVITDREISRNSPTAIGPKGEIIVGGSPTTLIYHSSGEFKVSFSARFTAQALAVSGTTVTLIGMPSANHGAVSRFDMNGTIDSTFGEGGLIRIHLNTPLLALNGLLLREDNSFFVSGYRDEDAITGPKCRGLLAAFTSTGSPNPGFNGGEPVISKYHEPCQWSSIGGDPARGLVVTGSTGLQGSESALIARYRNTGELDDSFGNKGYLETSFDTGIAKAISMLVQADQKPVVSIDRPAKPTIVRYLA